MNVLLIRKNLLLEDQIKLLGMKDVVFKTIHQNDFIKFQNSEESVNVNIIVGATELGNLDFDRFPNLKFIQLISAGYDYLQIEEIISRKICLSNASGVYSVPIAEWVIGLILADFKYFFHFYNKSKEKNWDPIYKLKELTNKRILVFGTGSIGLEITKRLSNFACIIDGVNSNGREVFSFNKSFTLNQAKQRVNEYDVLIFALPSNQSTRGYVNKDFMLKLKEDTVVINVGRGDLIDDNDLIDFVNNTNKEVRFYLDVSNDEPLNENSELWGSSKIFITPHNSFSSDKHLDRLQALVFSNINALINNTKITNQQIGE